MTLPPAVRTGLSSITQPGWCSSTQMSRDGPKGPSPYPARTDHGESMPPQFPAGHDEPSEKHAVRRTAFVLLSSSWLVVLLYAIYVADDPMEHVLNSLLLVL